MLLDVQWPTDKIGILAVDEKKTEAMLSSQIIPWRPRSRFSP